MRVFVILFFLLMVPGRILSVHAASRTAYGHGLSCGGFDCGTVHFSGHVRQPTIHTGSVTCWKIVRSFFSDGRGGILHGTLREIPGGKS